ncbi:MAG: hypothetical protein WD577_03985 [Bacteroidales bacterium]
MSSVFDIDAARKFQRNKLKRQQEALDERFERATRDFDAICQMIIRDFQPIAIYQWGSLLDRKKFSDISDIDIAVEGITDAQDYFTLLRRADEMTKFPVDIVQLEKIHPLHSEMIIKKGVKIYRK